VILCLLHAAGRISLSKVSLPEANMRNSKSKAVFVLLCVVALMALPGEASGGAFAVLYPTITPPSAPQPEGTDFATSVLRDPWDMSEFTDISQYLNESGQRNLVKNIVVANGVFTATSVRDASTDNAYFFLLFPGYEGTIQAGKVGSRYPIPKSTDKCLYIAMKVNSGPANNFGPDQYRIFWFADDRLTNGPYGQTQGIALYPEAGAGQPVQSWRLYSVNLSTAASLGTAWNSMPSVEGLRIDPTINANIDFAVDWVRLTDCSAVNVGLTWTGGTSNDTAIWLRPVGTDRDIRVATGVTGTSSRFPAQLYIPPPIPTPTPTGTFHLFLPMLLIDYPTHSYSYNLDIQGIAPGYYYVGLGTNTTCCLQMNTSQPLVIDQTPIVSFVRPSFFSGPDYASQAGNSWDFGDNTDVTGLLNFKNASFQNGELNMVTASGPQPAGVDAQIILDTLPINTGAYRYLTFRMSTQNGSAPWQNVVDGMIARLVWSVQGTSGRPGYRCNLVSQDIPYDVGYQTYSIDLYNTFYGQAEETQGECTGLPTTWQASSPVLELRFDPNENISCNPQFSPFVVSTCGDYIQKLDWIQLTAVDQVVQGNLFPVQITLNDSPATVSLTFFYTTTLANPTQFRAQLYTPLYTPPIQMSTGTSQLFLPILLRNYPTVDTFPEADVTYPWDTTNVPPGTYYNCVQANDGYNTATYCSESPMKVVVP
jgi:hypothetical protein